MPAQKTKLSLALRRGLQGLCPRCGQGVLFIKWASLQKSCLECHLVFEENSGDSWGFMYVSTAFMTGLIIIAMFVWQPAHLWLGRIFIFTVVGLAITLTIPMRKGIAVALDYLTRFDDPSNKLDP